MEESGSSAGRSRHAPLAIIKDAVEARWNAAASLWEVNALAGLYTRDALFFGLLPDLYVGRSEIERYFDSYRNIVTGVSLNLVEQHTRQLTPDAFVAQGFGQILNYRSNSAIELNRVRTSLVIVRVEGEWLISLHHFSHVPQADDTN
jgi:uncharacterized protein (TIGR02246 family)